MKSGDTILVSLVKGVSQMLAIEPTIRYGVDS